MLVSAKQIGSQKKVTRLVIPPKTNYAQHLTDFLSNFLIIGGTQEPAIIKIDLGVIHVTPTLPRVPF